MTAVDDLVRWLTQVWDEEEARERAKRTWGTMVPQAVAYLDGRVRIKWTSGYEEDLTEDEFDFRYVDSDRQMLARIAADRKILELHSPNQPAMYLASVPVVVDPSIPSDEIHFRTGKPHCPECGPRDDEEAPCKTVRLLAQPYADRPGYQESWAVQ